jgi:hypothetical protein
MAAHRRTEIRSLVVDRLVESATLAGAQIYPGRFQPAHEEELENGGVLFVYTFDEKVPAEDYPPSNNRAGLRRTLEIVIDGLVPAFDDETPDTADYSGDAMARADLIAAQVEDAMETWDPPGFGSSVLRLRASKVDVSADEGGMPVGKATLTYSFAYTTPYRDCSDPMVDNESENILLRGLYPGGQIVEGCPAGNTGETCPIPPPDGNVEGVLDHLGSPVILPRDPNWPAQ